MFQGGDTDEDIRRWTQAASVSLCRIKTTTCWKRMYLHGKHLPSGYEHEKLDDWLDFRQLPGLEINAMPSTSLQNVQFSLDVA